MFLACRHIIYNIEFKTFSYLNGQGPRGARSLFLVLKNFFKIGLTWEPGNSILRANRYPFSLSGPPRITENRKDN